MLFSRIVASVANASELADVIGIPKAKELVDRALHRAAWAVEKQGGRVVKMAITHLVAEVPLGQEDEAAREIVVRAQSVLAPPPLRLLIEVGKDDGADDEEIVAIVRHGLREYPLAPDACLNVGRDPGNRIVLIGKSISRHHGQIASAEKGIVYTDRSANGTWIQLFDKGQPFHVRAETIELPNGAILTIGRSHADNEAGERIEIHPAEIHQAIPRAA